MDDRADREARRQHSPAAEGRLKRVWGTLNTPLIATIVGGVVVVVAGAALGLSALTRDDDDASQRAAPGQRVSQARSATEEAAGRSIWAEAPDTFKQAVDALSYAGNGDGTYIATVAAIDPGGDVSAFTPKELYDDAASLQGLPVIVVGRVVSDSSQQSRFDVRRVTRLVGREPGFDTYVGTNRLTPFDDGDVVFAAGRVAAAGISRDPAGKRMQTTYFLSLLDNGGTVESVVDFETGSDAILERARSVRQRKDG